MTDSKHAYLDSSALVKLVREEAESAAMQRYIVDNPNYTSSALAIVEVLRNAIRQGPPAEARAREVLDVMEFVEFDRELLETAAALGPPTLRSLDAIHLASAMRLGEELGAVVTYDVRMQDAARALGLTAVAPS
jgi:predicted nucleic acid-binding protein